jgi:hypothetical protein
MPRGKTRHITLILALALVAACDSGSSGSGGSPGVRPPPPDVTSVDGNGNTDLDATALAAQLSQLPLGTLSDAEIAGLLYMREEEKLARDVYTTLGGIWGQNVFVNIAASEQTHTDAVLMLIVRYGLTDPVGTNPPGVFSDPVLQGLHDVLAARGSASLIDALIVGAEIEEIDIIDIDARLEGVLDNRDIELVYENLKKGSRNHLRAFIRNLDNQNYPYQPQYLTQEAFDAIIDSPTETGGVQ